jgi:hypothetical protein
MEEVLDAVNRPEKKKVNALLIICLTVGCAKGTVRTIRNNAEEIKGFAKSGNKVISCFKMFIYGMCRKDVEYMSRGLKKILYSLFLCMISNIVCVCVYVYIRGI